MRTTILKGALACALALGASGAYAEYTQFSVQVPATINLSQTITAYTSGMNFGVVNIKSNPSGFDVTMDKEGLVSCPITNGVTSGVTRTGFVSVTAPSDISCYVNYSTTPITMTHSGGGMGDGTVTLTPALYHNETLITSNSTTNLITGAQALEVKVAGIVHIGNDVATGVYDCNVPVTVFWE